MGQYTMKLLNNQKTLLAALSFVTVITLPITSNANTINQPAKSVIQEALEMVQVKNKLKTILAKDKFTNLEKSPVKGLYQAQIAEQVIYFSPEQELIIFGEILTKDGVSLTRRALDQWQAEKLAQLDLSSALIVGSGPIEIIEFTDPDCPFCQRFSNWIEEVEHNYQLKNNKNLFTRKVILTPIASLHPDAHKEAEHVLCSEQSKQSQALTDVLNNKVDQANLLNCESGKGQLAKHDALAQQYGVTGTPLLIVAGSVVNGFDKPRLEKIIGNEVSKLNLVSQSKE